MVKKHSCEMCGVPASGQKKNKFGKVLCFSCYHILINEENRQKYIPKRYSCEHCGRPVHAARKNKFGKILCAKHYEEMHRVGKLGKRTRHTPNEFILHASYAEMIIFDQSCVEKCRTLIDLEDVDHISHYKWGVSDNLYVNGQIDGERVRLHRVLLGITEKNLVVDHINHNTLDNRKSNLRKATKSENGANSRRPKRAYPTGVSYDLNTKSFRAQLVKDGKQYYKCVKTLQEAIEIRKSWEIEHFREFRYGE